MRRVALFALACLALAACSKAKVAEASLEMLGGGASSPASCPAEKCLTVFVAPWCGYCRAATPALLKLRDHLAPKHVAVRFVVSMDKLEAVREYAAVFGPDTMLDPDNAAGVRGGVPHFYVTEKSGKILHDLAGVPRVDTVEELAAYFGLP